VRLDFANVKFLSSAALGKMVTLAKKAKSLSVRLVLCNIDPMIQEVLAITNLKKLFEIE
jgi:anti-sigma B factor antagonist